MTVSIPAREPTASLDTSARRPAAARLLVILCLAVLSAWPACAASPYERGVMAYEAGNFEDALSEFRRLSMHGKADAEFMLGVLYFYGKGVSSSPAMAAIWFQRAAVKGDANAQLAFGSLHIRGLGVHQDLGKAYLWLTLAAASHTAGVRRQAQQLLDEAGRLMTPPEILSARQAAADWRPKKAGFSLKE